MISRTRFAVVLGLLFGSIPSVGFPLQKKDCSVWFEINSEKLLHQYLEYQESWQRLGGPIATTRRNQIDLVVGSLRQENIHASSGVKTPDYLDATDYLNPTGWERLSADARKIAELTEGAPVILDNETGLNQLLEANADDFAEDDLVAVLSAQAWPTIWYWLAPASRLNTRHVELSAKVARAIMRGIPSARLIESNSAGYKDSASNQASQANLHLTLQIDPDPVSIIYLDDTRPRFWRFGDTIEAIATAYAEDVILYPGVGDLEMADRMPSISHVCR